MTAVDVIATLRARLYREAGAMRTRLVEWAEVNSFSANRVGLDYLRGLVCEAFTAAFPSAEVEEVPVFLSEGEEAAPALRLRCRPEAPLQVLLNGHLDTVYPPDGGFTTCTRLDANTLRGPGVTDMKGGLVVLLHALSAFEALSEADAIGWTVLLTGDEETGSVASRPLLEAEARRHHIGIVYESALPDGALIRRRMGSGNFTFRVQGRAAHVGRDFSAGRNALVAVAGLARRLHEVNTALPGTIFNVGALAGGGALNVVPAAGELRLNVRVPSAALQEEALRLMEEARAATEGDGIGCTLEGAFNRPPKECPPQVEALFALWQEAGDAMDLPLDWRDTGGGSDGNILLAAGLPNIDNLGVRGGQIHSPEEFCLLDSLPERALLSAVFLHRLATGEATLPTGIIDSSPSSR